MSEKSNGKILWGSVTCIAALQLAHKRLRCWWGFLSCFLKYLFISQVPLILFLNYVTQFTNLYNLHNIYLKGCSEIVSKIIYLEFLGLTSARAKVISAPMLQEESKAHLSILFIKESHQLFKYKQFYETVSSRFLLTIPRYYAKEANPSNGKVSNTRR